MAKARYRVPAEAKLRQSRSLPASVPVVALVREDLSVDLYQSVRTHADFYNHRRYAGGQASRSDLTDSPGEVMLAYLEHWLDKSKWQLLGLKAQPRILGDVSPRTLTLDSRISVLEANETARRLGMPMFFVDEGEVAESLGLASLSPTLTLSAELATLLDRTRTNIGFWLKFGSPPKHTSSLLSDLIGHIDDLLWCLRKQVTRRRLWSSAVSTAEFLERFFIWWRDTPYIGIYHVVQSIANERVVLTHGGEVHHD